MARYGQPFWWVRNSLKKWLKDNSSQDRNKAITDWINNQVGDMTDLHGWKRSGQIQGGVANGLKFALEREFYYHVTTRLYVQDLDLIEFLKSTSCPQTGAALAAMRDFMDKYGSVVHLLTPDKKAVTFLIGNCPNIPDWMTYGVYHANKYVQLYITDSTNSISDAVRATFGPESDKSQVQDVIESCEIMANLLYYIATFPDALIDGAPTDKGGIQLLPKSNHSVVIKTHPDIVEPRIPGSRATHFRHGHYRFLKSERFTHMQGKFVFVRGSIVHGSTAKTVVG